MKSPLRFSVELVGCIRCCLIVSFSCVTPPADAGSVCVESVAVAVDTRAFGSCIESVVFTMDTRTEYDLWAENAGLVGGFALTNSRPFGDSVDNLSKWAFDLAGNQADSSVTNGSTHGLPLIVAVDRDGVYVLRASLVQRTGVTGLSYDPLLSEDLATWATSMAVVSRVALSPGWETVVYEAPVALGSRQFCKVKVTYLPP